MPSKNKKLDILLVPSDGTGKMRKLKYSYSFFKFFFFFSVFLIFILGGLSTYLYFDNLKKSEQLYLRKNAENIVNQYELQTENERLRSQLAFLKKRINENFITVMETEEFENKVKSLLFANIGKGAPKGGFLYKNEKGYQFDLKYYSKINDADLFLEMTTYKDLNTALLNDYQKYVSENLGKLNSSIVSLYGNVVERYRILLSTPSIWPVRGWISSTFGIRNDPFEKTKKFHEGLDIANNPGTPIKATADGIVAFVGVNGGYGNVVIINHLNDIQTRYAHLQSYIVKSGQHIKKGQIIGYLGNTGRSSGPHLHYEVRKNGIPVNPKLYIIE